MKKLIFIVYLFCFVQAFAQQNKSDDIVKAKHDYINFIQQHSHFINTPNIELHYLQWGNPNKPAFIWLHGSLSNAIELEPFAKSITELGYQLIAIDYYGHGQTPIPKGEFSVKTLMNDISHLLDSLSIQQCVIGGFSRGAYFATVFYDQFPNKVHALILEDGGVSPFLEHYKLLSKKGLKKKFNSEINSRPNELFKTFDTEDEAYQVLQSFNELEDSQRYKNFYYIRKTANGFSIYNGMDELYGMNTYKNIKSLMKNKLTKNKFANQLMIFPFFETIQKTSIPVLLLEAKSPNDFFPNSIYYNKLKHSNKNISLHTFEQSDHNIHYEESQKFINCIIDFLKHNKP